MFDVKKDDHVVITTHKGDEYRGFWRGETPTEVQWWSERVGVGGSSFLSLYTSQVSSVLPA